jgi:hypothetical protein
MKTVVVVLVGCGPAWPRLRIAVCLGMPLKPAKCANKKSIY